jgi:23S rRNA (uracil1939-C5)-methyltransferase
MNRMPVSVGAPEYGGAFLCGAERLVFGVIPGETVELTADAFTLLKSSPVRAAAGCIHFGVCGGCQYQHAEYPAQLDFKRQILERLFAEAKLTTTSIQIHAAQPWAYRNRIRVRLGLVDGVLRPGYSRRATNEFLPVAMCPIAAPLLMRAAEALASAASSGGAAARWVNSVAEAEFFCTPEEDHLQIQFLLGQNAPVGVHPGSFERLCERLRELLPELAGAGAAFSPDVPRRVRRAAVEQSWGASGILYPAAGRAYWVSRGSFFQVNRFLLDDLVKLVCPAQGDIEPGAVAWDLFAGVGLFSRALAQRFSHVVAVEGGEAAAADLEAASHAGKGEPAFLAVRQSTLDFLRARQHQRERPALIVLDPPRAGLGPEGAAILNYIAAPAVTYVSCDPTTLVRDLAILTTGAYAIEAVHLIDLFPQTFHLETVVHLRLR